MAEAKEDGQEKKTLSLGAGKKTLSLGGAQAAKIRQQMEGTRPGGGIAVEVRRKRISVEEKPQDVNNNDNAQQAAIRNMTTAERENRAQMIRDAIAAEEKRKAEQLEKEKAAEEQKQQDAAPKETPEEAARRIELEEIERIDAEEQAKVSEAELLRQKNLERMRTTPPSSLPSTRREDEDDSTMRERLKRGAKPPKAREGDERRRSGKITVTQVLNDDFDKDGGRSLAAQRRAQAKARKAALGPKEPAQKIYREVIVPEAITVQELANRMSERSADLIKSLMKMGVMATINQTIDADTAELIIGEFGHTIKRVSEADVEEGLEGIMDTPEHLQPRPPVVTIMGHVDHGKTSLLDALRATDVVAGEAGGITQHIGAYQVTLANGNKITFLDTPGHAAFTQMRARGANVTDIVVLVVSADDSVMPQTIEAIRHAKAAGVPMIVAINKIDKPDANPTKIKQDLLQYGVVVEEMGGDVQCIEISAKKKINLDKLEEAILLQAEILELKANPDREAVGTVIESKQEIGRGSVSTILIETGTLKIGDIFVVGTEFGKVRALINDKNEHIKLATPGMPVEVLGLNGTPDAGDRFVVVESEAKAREVADYRARKKREKETIAGAVQGQTFEDIISAAKAQGQKQILPVVIKADVHGSVEAIVGSLNKMTEDNDEIGINVLMAGVGGITESDITLAKASNAMVIGFNVRANPQARELAHRENIELNYYNVIYNVIDDAKSILSGMLSPEKREEHIGNAQIREVFNITKVGKIAGCMITNGFVKRGAGVRLLRDDVVIHEGKLKTLKRFKDEVKEVKEGMECGMAFENYEDIKEGDIIECFEVVETARTLA
ncbi:MAG: translation initiation factor IF-2 [Rhodospirillales bacterium]|nr:translation initiation factor IF-2 [Rhodospirillales bacterium]MCB9973538.1 translation initiation factor IF-2 [Rhodospirillales bacterium]